MGRRGCVWIGCRVWTVTNRKRYETLVTCSPLMALRRSITVHQDVFDGLEKLRGNLIAEFPGSDVTFTEMMNLAARRGLEDISTQGVEELREELRGTDTE